MKQNEQKFKTTLPCVAFQGASGAYSEAALRKHFGNEVKAIGLALSENVCQALLKSEVDYAILPIENSIVGNVNVNADLILQYPFFAIAEVFLPIEHCLLAAQGTLLEDIKNVYSHPVALEQCRDFLINHNMNPIPEFDTAGSCQKILESPSHDQATVASELCCEYYGLTVIKRDIQKVKNNFTRFLVLVNQENRPKNLVMEKTSVAFTAKHHPGALLDCLNVFAFFKINLTRLESRPVAQNPFEYTFLADFHGGLSDIKVKRCLEELQERSYHVKVLGSYPIGHIVKSSDLQ